MEIRRFFLLLSLTLAGAAAKSTSTVTLASTGSLSIVGRPVTFTATVAPAGATGKVTFFDGVTPLGVAGLAAGKAVLTTSQLPAGVRSLQAIYSGDGGFQSSVSAILAMRVVSYGENGFTAAAAITGVGSPRVVATGDFNGDGKVDLAATDFVTNKLSVLLGRGDGTFQTPVAYVMDASRPSSAPFGIVVGDFNGDGRADIAAVNGAFGIGSVAILLGNGDGTFRSAVNYAAGGYAQGLATADFNGDGVEDLVVTDFGNNAVVILTGNGDGTFRAGANYPAGTGPTFVAVGDCNGDGLPDLAVATSSAVELLTGNGDGTFKLPVRYAAGKNVTAIAVADFDGDGRADLAVTNGADNDVSILLGNGGGTFQAAVNYVTGADPVGITCGDFKGDGVPDLAVANANGNKVSILIGNGDGAFQPASNYNTGGGAVCPVAADFNGDGRSDLAVATYYSVPGVSIFLGAPGPDFPAIAAVVNGATFTDTGLAPGLVFTVAGLAMGPAAGTGPQLDSSGRVATNVSGVQVLVGGYPRHCCMSARTRSTQRRPMRFPRWWAARLPCRSPTTGCGAQASGLWRLPRRQPSSRSATDKARFSTRTPASTVPAIPRRRALLCRSTPRAKGKPLPAWTGRW